MSTATKAVIGLLCAGAAVLIVMTLGGVDGDSAEARALVSAVAVVFFLLTATSGVALNRGRPELAWFGSLTALVSLAALAGVTLAVWGALSGSDEGWGKAVAIAALLALAGAHASLLLALRYRDSGARIRALRNATLILLGALAAFAVYAISASGSNIDPKVITVVVILYFLGAMILPLATRGAEPATAEDADATVGRPPAATGVTGLDHVVIAVSDLDRSTYFYENALGGEVVARPNGRIAYRFGSHLLNVHGPETQAQPLAAAPVPGTATYA